LKESFHHIFERLFFSFAIPHPLLKKILLQSYHVFKKIKSLKSKAFYK